MLEELREDRALRSEDVPVAMHHARSGALVVADVGWFTTEGHFNGYHNSAAMQ